MGFAVSKVTLAATSLAEITDAIAEVNPCFKWDILNNTFLAIQGTWTKNDHASNFDIGSVCSNTSVAPSVNDEVGLGAVFIPEDGTYEVKLIGFIDASFGNIHVHLKGVDKATIDMYIAGASFDYNASKTVTLGALTKGLYPVSLIMLDKNASSSGYNCSFQTITITKTA